MLKLGADNTDREVIMGRHGIGEQKENGELFTEFCTFNDTVIGGTVFPTKKPHKSIWISPDGKTANHIDRITISRKWMSLHHLNVKCGADAVSDHHLVVAVLKIKLKTYNYRAESPSHK